MNRTYVREELYVGRYVVVEVEEVEVNKETKGEDGFNISLDSTL